MSFVPSFKVGDIVSNQQICNEFKCFNACGMRPSKTTNTLVIVSDHTKSLYEDKWFGDELHYTGMGKRGNQALTRQNRTLAESNTNGVEVHLFEVLEPAQYIYQGVVKLSGEKYQEVQNDVDGQPRTVWMFPLRKVNDDILIEQSVLDAYIEDQAKKVKRLSDEELEAKAKERSSSKVANRRVISKTYVRDASIAENSKRRAKGICQLCREPAPFNDKDGEPYLESHHIIWLANGGADSVENTVALCPNCHRKMHVVNDPSDVKKLQELNS